MCVGYRITLIGKDLDRFVYQGHKHGDQILITGANGSVIEYLFEGKEYYVSLDVLKKNGRIQSYKSR